VEVLINPGRVRGGNHGYYSIHTRADECFAQVLSRHELLHGIYAELWLPDGRRKATAEDVSNSPRRLCLFRKVIIASGFAGPLFGVNGKKLTDGQLDSFTKDYRLIHFKQD
jgi:hypothetical protein